MSRPTLRFLYTVSAVLFFICSSETQTPQLTSVLDLSDFIQDWKISKQFTLEVANAMPAEFYSFKPNPEEMTFGEQMAAYCWWKCVPFPTNNGYSARRLSSILRKLLRRARTL